MVQLAILAAFVAGAATYFMKPDERMRLLGVARTGMGQVRDGFFLADVDCAMFFDALRARTQRVIAAPAIVLLSFLVYFGAVWAPGPVTDLDTLVGWGGNLALRTANGDWWRVLTTMLLHARMVDLLINALCLLQIALILERMVGRPAFLIVFFASGAAAGIVSLSMAPDVVSAGASGGVLGLYTLVAVTSTWCAVRSSPLSIPLDVAKRLAPMAAIFVVYNIAAPGLGRAAQAAALACGAIAGIIVARDITERTPPLRRMAAALTTVVTILTVGAVVVRNRPAPSATDVRPEIQRVIAVELRTAGLYNGAVDRFRRGRINAAALASVIEKTIVPDLRGVAARLKTLHDVPPEHQPLIAKAGEFLRLRDESWQMRAAALHHSDMLGLRQADSREESSLEAFRRIKVPRGAGGA